MGKKNLDDLMMRNFVQRYFLCRCDKFAGDNVSMQSVIVRLFPFFPLNGKCIRFYTKSMYMYF